MNTISMKDVLVNVNKCSDGEITVNELSEYISKNLIVKRYIPIMEKHKIVEKIFKYVDKLNSNIIGGSGVSVELELIFVIYGLCEYTNICSENDDITIANYDILMESGIIDSILSICKADYDILRSMFTTTVFTNILTEADKTIGVIAKNNAVQVKEMNKLIGNKDGMNSFLEILKFNNQTK